MGVKEHVMSLANTVFTLFQVQITWKHLCIAAAVLAVHYILFGLNPEPKPRIRIRRALRQAAEAGIRNYKDLLKFFLVEVCFIMIGLAPLLFLLEPDMQYAAAITYPFFLLVIIPARMNAAAAMQDCLSGGSVFSCRLIDYSGIRRKVMCGIKRMLLLPIWAVPMVISLDYAYRLWKGEDDMDGFSLLQSIQDFGGGDVKKAILYILLITAGLILILMIGAGFHSGARHALALGNPRMVDGHHGKIVLGWLLATLVFMLPLWIAIAIVLVQVLPVLLNDMNGLIMHTVSVPRPKTMLLILGLGGLLTVPLMPVRSLMVAAMVHQLKDEGENTGP